MGGHAGRTDFYTLTKTGIHAGQPQHFYYRKSFTRKEKYPLTELSQRGKRYLRDLMQKSIIFTSWGRIGIDRKVNGLVSMPEYDSSSPLTNGYQQFYMAPLGSPWLPNSRN